MNSRNPFRVRLGLGERLLGVLVRMPGEVSIELAGLQGLDFVVIDTGLGSGGQRELLGHLLAVKSVGLEALVRVGARDEIARVLDLGATGVIVPHVSSIDDALAAVKAAHYLPLGERLLAADTRAGGYGLVPAADQVRAGGTDTVVIVEVEDPPGVAAARQVSSVQGVDGILVARGELAHAMGLTGQSDAASVLEAVAEAQAAAHAAGGVVVSIATDSAAVASQFATGADLVVYDVQAALGNLLGELARARSFEGPATAREPVVLLPGMLGDARVFESVLHELDGSVAPYFGRLDLDDSVPDMAETVLAAAPRRFALAGHSLGGIVALEIARRAPERITRLALLNTSARAPNADQLQAWQVLRGRAEAGAFLSLVSELSRSNLPPGSSTDLVELCDDMARAVGVGGLIRQLDAQSARSDLRASLAQIRVPTLVVSGALDTVCPPSVQSELAAAIPGATHVIIEGTGHMSLIEDPVRVGALLRQWLATGP